MSQGGLGFGGDTPAILRAFVKQTGITYPVLLGAGNVGANYVLPPQTAPFPIDVVIDKKGVITYLSGRYNASSMESAVLRALK